MQTRVGFGTKFLRQNMGLVVTGLERVVHLHLVGGTTCVGLDRVCVHEGGLFGA